MSEHNPFSPPRANVDAPLAPAQGAATARPALWNPGAAAAWSLLFSPIFGALIHMKNWQALGDSAKAAEARTWAQGCGAFMALAMLSAALLPESRLIDVAVQGAGLGLLVAWYTMSAKAQVALVKARFATDYPRRGWGMPILYAIGLFVAAIVALTVVLVIVSPEA